jgi:hypothetical protein
VRRVCVIDKRIAKTGCAAAKSIRSGPSPKVGTKPQHVGKGRKGAEWPVEIVERFDGWDRRKETRCRAAPASGGEIGKVDNQIETVSEDRER